MFPDLEQKYSQRGGEGREGLLQRAAEKSCRRGNTHRISSFRVAANIWRITGWLHGQPASRWWCLGSSVYTRKQWELRKYPDEPAAPVTIKTRPVSSVFPRRKFGLISYLYRDFVEIVQGYRQLIYLPSPFPRLPLFLFRFLFSFRTVAARILVANGIERS